ncbi:MAG: hypothetical protein VKM68_01675 [Cyanobacteriota bacterium]|nr:hypothetical protein [Cyanobacteriota bacterium]
MPLPAPYAPPWKRLGEDLVATLAWLGLKGREGWRRNGEGSLPAPPFWPRRWLPLFWPLVLAGVLLVVVVVGRMGWAGAPAGDGGGEPVGLSADGGGGPAGLSADGGSPVAFQDHRTRRQGREDRANDVSPNAPAGEGMGTGSGSPQEPATVERSGAPIAAGNAPPPSKGVEAVPTKGEDPSEGGTNGLAKQEGQASSDGAGEAPSVSTDPASAHQEDEASTAEDDKTSPEDGASSATEVETNRLWSAWSAHDRDHLLTALTPDPATATLTLQLDPAFAARPAPQRQRLAEGWRERASAAGYDHLRLRDGRGRLLGRDALVGGGMILLEPAPEERPAP